VSAIIPEEDSPAEKRFATLVALLIAAVSVAGAVVAWRASVAADGAGGADEAGIRATINLTETRALAAVNGYADYAAFARYIEFLTLADALEAQYANLPAEAAPAEAELLLAQLVELRDRTTAATFAFPAQYINRDGTYALQRQQGELFADAAREKDLAPDTSFAQADALRGQTNRLLLALSGLAGGLVLLTLIEAAGRRLKYALLLAGVLAFVAGGISAYLIDQGRL
jgi:hypothetical protein